MNHNFFAIFKLQVFDKLIRDFDVVKYKFILPDFIQFSGWLQEAQFKDSLILRGNLIGFRIHRSLRNVAEQLETFLDFPRVL